MSMRILLVSLAAAVLAPQDIQVRPRLVAGDTFRLEVTRVREDSSRPQANYSGRTPIDVRVVSAGAEGFVLLWRPGATVLEGSAAAPDPALSMAGRIIGNAEFRVVLTADGEYERLANQAEITQKFEAARDAAIRLAGTGLSADDRKRMDDLMRQILSPANLVAIATRDVQSYVAMHGLALAVGETLEFAIEQPSPFGGGVIPAVFRARMESATPDTATVTTTTTFDPEALLKMTAAIAEQAGAKPAAEELAKFRLDISDDGTYVFDRKVGLMREVTINRRSSVGATTQLDRWVIRLVTAPTR